MNSGTPLYWAVVAAAGGGSRMRADRPKQYLRVAGRSLLEHSLAALQRAPWIRGIVVVLAPDDREFDALSPPSGAGFHRAAGGATRVESVLAGLRQVATAADRPPDSIYVLVHDAARPCIRPAELERLRDEATDEHGGLLAVPVTDTLKRSEGARAAATVDRRDLWRAQTPQMFRLDLLMQAAQACVDRGVEVTDESAAMEAAGFRPRLVMGHVGNIKVTYPEDLAVADFWLTGGAGR